MSKRAEDSSKISLGSKIEMDVDTKKEVLRGRSTVLEFEGRLG